MQKITYQLSTYTQIESFLTKILKVLCSENIAAFDEGMSKQSEVINRIHQIQDTIVKQKGHLKNLKKLQTI